MHQGIRSWWPAIKLGQRQVTVSGIVWTYVYILHLRYEDAILAILCTSLPITATIAGKWFNSLTFHDNNKYVTRPVIIEHVSTNYIELYFCQYLPFRMWYSISVSCRRKPIKFCSSDKDFVAVV